MLVVSSMIQSLRVVVRSSLDLVNSETADLMSTMIIRATHRAALTVDHELSLDYSRRRMAIVYSNISHRTASKGD